LYVQSIFFLEASMMQSGHETWRHKGRSPKRVKVDPAASSWIANTNTIKVHLSTFTLC